MFWKATTLSFFGFFQSFEVHGTSFELTSAPFNLKVKDTTCLAKCFTRSVEESSVVVNDACSYFRRVHQPFKLCRTTIRKIPLFPSKSC